VSSTIDSFLKGVQGGSCKDAFADPKHSGEAMSAKLNLQNRAQSQIQMAKGEITNGNTATAQVSPQLKDLKGNNAPLMQSRCQQAQTEAKTTAGQFTSAASSIKEAQEAIQAAQAKYDAIQKAIDADPQQKTKYAACSKVLKQQVAGGKKGTLDGALGELSAISNMATTNANNLNAFASKDVQSCIQAAQALDSKGPGAAPGGPTTDTVKADSGPGMGTGLLIGGLAGAGLGVVGGMMLSGSGDDDDGGGSSKTSSTTTSTTCPAGQTQNAFGTCVAAVTTPTNNLGDTTEATDGTETTKSVNVGAAGSLDTAGGLSSGTAGGAVGRGDTSSSGAVPVAAASGSGLASDGGSSSSGGGSSSGTSGSAVGRGLAMADTGSSGGSGYARGYSGESSDTAPADAKPGTVYNYNFIPKDHPRGYKWVRVGKSSWNLIPDCSVNPAACKTRLSVQKKLKRSLASDAALK
jgi:hypothetical protein